MSFRPFQSEFADHRVVLIPAGLDAEHRARFVAKLAAAAKQQAGLAASCDAVLRVSGEIEVDGDRVRIPHEPAAPGDPAAFAEDRERPGINEVWWLSWALVEALKAAAPGTPHGGIQIATLYLDQTGRVKLGDFGIAPVFEVVCGAEARRRIHCDGLVRRGDGAAACSGVWSLLGEDDARDYGWVAPYFSHELLEGSLRLNPKSDQFAAGTLLFLLATGTHPYGASLADPTMMFYFHLEPYTLRDERSEWTEVFEREAGGFSTAADKPILAWAKFIRKLLAADPGERFANAVEAENATGEFVPDAWKQAAAAISAGLKLLDAGEVDAFLEKTAPWGQEEALPEPWRAPLQEWIADVEARKEEIGAYKRLEQRLAEAQESLNNVEVDRARAIAREVQDAPQCDDRQRAAAEELIALCDEQEEFIRSGADDLARAYLESARECLERDQLDEARQMLNGLLQDPATPAARSTQARRLVAEIELIEQRREQQLSELAGASDDLDDGHYEAARQRLEALLAEKDLPENISAQAHRLLVNVSQLQARRAAYVEALETARTAWERADLDALRAQLGVVPEDFTDPEIADVRADLAGRCEPLAAGLAQREEAVGARAAGDPDAALESVKRARAAGQLPQVLCDQLDALAEECRAEITRREQERLERASAALEQARAACEALRTDECRQRLAADVTGQAGLSKAVISQADELLRTCEAVDRARSVFEHTQEHLDAGELKDAGALLESLKSKGLPATAVTELERLRAELARACAARAESERRKLASRLEEIADVLAGGKLAEAESALAAVAASEYLSDELREQIAANRATIAKHRPVLETIRAAEAALPGDPAVLVKRLAALKRLPADLPDWATARVESVRQRAEELAAQRRAEAIQKGAAALDAAQAALGRGDVAVGQSQLAAARKAIELDAALAERHAELAGLAAQLERWLPRVEAVARVVQQGDLVRARDELSGALAQASIPEPCRTNLAELKEHTDAQIAVRLREIDAALAALAAELEQRGRRARKFPERASALTADALATSPQRTRAAELLERFERLPVPTPSKVPLVAAGSVLGVAVIAIVLYFSGAFGGGNTGDGDGSGGGGSGVPNVREQIVTALASLRSELADAEAWARANDRVVGEWTLAFEPAGALPTTLVALQAAERDRREELGGAVTVDELRALHLTDPLRERLFPERAPPLGPTVAERMAEALEALQAQVDAAREAAGGDEGDRPRFVVRFEPAGALPAVLIAADRATRDEVRLGTVEEAGLPGLTLTEAWRARIYPPPPEPTIADLIAVAVERLQAEADAARPEAAAPRYALRIEPADRLPAAVIARNVETGEEARLGTVAQAELAALALTKEWRARLYPPEPPLERRVAAAVAKLQEEVDAAREEADRPDAPAPRYVVRIEPADGLPAELIATNAESQEAVRLGAVSEAELAALMLKEEWRAQLYPPPPPPPTLAEATEAYVDELGRSPLRIVVRDELLPRDDGALEVAARWNERDLVPFAGLRFEAGEGRLAPPAATVLEYFKLQIEALEALGKLLTITIPLDDPQAPAYEAVLRLAESVAEIDVEGVDLESRGVGVATAVRLDGDPRESAAFPFRAVYAGGKFTIADTAAARSAFNEYLRGLQAHQLPEALRGITADLALPAGVELAVPAGFAGGRSLPLRVLAAEEHPLTTLTAIWNRETLLYEVDAGQAVAALRAGVRAIAQDEATRRALRAAWPDFRSRLTPPDSQPGTGYFGRLELLAVAPRAEQPDKPFVVLVDANVGSAQGTEAERIRIPARLVWENGALGWDRNEVTEARAAIVAGLRRLDQDEALRALRRREAVAQLASEPGVAAVQNETVEGDALRVEIDEAGGRQVVTWTWDRAELRYGGRTKVAKAPEPVLGLDGKLERLASQPSADWGAFGEALAEVTRKKIERYGVSNYSAAAAFTGAVGAQAGLTAASRGLQRLTAPTLQRDAYPVVFIEYYVGERDVYALGWRAEAGDDDAITSVSGARVWQVMPRSTLLGYARPGDFRTDYSSNAGLGERLLGPALGGALLGSRPGGGSFGVMIAPDGPLWLTRWEQVRFNPRPLRDVNLNGTPDPGPVERLRELLKPERVGRNERVFRRAALWCVPTLLGEWRGAGDSIEQFDLGVLLAGTRSSTLRFRDWGELTFATVEDPTARSSLAFYTQDAPKLRAWEIGQQFWDHSWDERGWQPIRLTSFALIPLAPRSD